MIATLKRDANHNKCGDLFLSGLRNLTKLKALTLSEASASEGISSLIQRPEAGAPERDYQLRLLRTRGELSTKQLEPSNR